MEGRKYNPFQKPDQSSGDHCSGQLIQLPVQDQQPMLPENHAIEPDHGFTEQFQIEDENNARGRLQPLSPNFAEESRKDASVDKPSNDLDFQSVDDASEPMESTHDLVDQSGKDICRPMESTHDLVYQSREDASGATETTHDLALQGADKIASLEAPEEYSDSVNVQQEQDHVKQHLKPLSLGGLSLNPQDKESVGLVPVASFEHDIPLETCVSEGILESCQNTNVNPSIACLRSSPAADSTQIQNDTDENESLSPSSSASNHNPRSTKAHPQPNVPANSGRNSHQMNNMLEASEDADSQPHEDLQNQYHQQQLVSPQQQCSSAELDAQKLMNQGHSHHPSSWRNPQIAQGTQAQNQYQAGAAQGSSTAIHAKPTQNVQQHSFVAVPQPQLSPQPVSQPQAQMSPCSLQSGEKLGHAQNSQAYNAASQYCYQQQQQMQQYLQPYQQQQQLQSQQQPDQQQLLLLQQQHYLQQQQHYQPQQMQQQQHLFYLQQHYQQFQQLQQQQSNQQWQQLLQQHQQQQNHQLQQWQQVQEGYQQMQQQQLLQQQQEYEQRLQQARLRPQEEYQKLQQLALQQSQQGYQQFVQQQQLQQQEEYEQRLQQARLQPQEEYQKLQQIAEQQLQQGYQQLQHQQQQEVQWQQQQDEEQLQHQLQITSTQNLTWDRSFYQQGQRATPPHSRAASGSAESPHIHQESPNAQSTGTSGPAASPYHQLQSPR